MSDPFENVRLVPAVQRGNQPMGWVYFVACRETNRCKIGFTKGEVERRIKSLQTGAAGKLVLIAKQPGSQDTERELHRMFAAQRLHGEWFEMSGELFAYLCATVWVMAGICIKEGLKPEPWVLSGLRMMHEEMGSLPDDLAFLIGKADLT